jgi:DNA-binding FadR family transcriptional regulator
VRRPAGDELSRHLELFIWGRNVGCEELHDVREALEALAAEGAARRRTDADLRELIEKTEAVEAAVHDVNAYLTANLDWHLVVARASHNELLVRFMNVLSNAIHDATALEAFDSPDVRASTLRIHRGILAAIVDGDADAARRRMTRHVAAAREVATSWNRAHQGTAPKASPDHLISPAKPAKLKKPRTAEKARAAGKAQLKRKEPQ